MSFMEDHPEWYGTYSDYHPEEIIKQTEIKELELEIAEFHEIISVSVVSDTTQMGAYGYKALVLYKA